MALGVAARKGHSTLSEHTATFVRQLPSFATCDALKTNVPHLMTTAAKGPTTRLHWCFHAPTLTSRYPTPAPLRLNSQRQTDVFVLSLFQLADDELDGSDRELDMEVGAELSELQWGNPSPPQPSSRPASSTTTFTCTDLAGRDTPASLDSIPLEWDHDYDLSRGLDSPGGRGLRERSKEQEEEEDEYLRTAAAVLSGRYIGWIVADCLWVLLILILIVFWDSFRKDCIMCNKPHSHTAYPCLAFPRRKFMGNRLKQQTVVQPSLH